MSAAEQQAQDTLLITPDFSEVKDRVEPGEYCVRIADSAVGKWDGKEGKKDTYWVNWTLETFNETETKNNGRKTFHRTPINGPGAFKLKEFYKAAMNGEECPVGGAGFDRSMLHTKELRIVVAQQKDNPQYTEVISVKPYVHIAS